MHPTIEKSHKLLDDSALALRDLDLDAALSDEDIKALREILMLANYLGFTAHSRVVLDSMRTLCRDQPTEAVQ